MLSYGKLKAAVLQPESEQTAKQPTDFLALLDVLGGVVHFSLMLAAMAGRPLSPSYSRMFILANETLK